MAVFKYLNANGQWEIIGSTGGDAKEVIKYIPQELTEDQKAQARDNIGAEDIVAINSAIEEAVGDLNTYIAIDENSDGNIEIREYIPEEDFIQIDKTLSVDGAAAEASVTGQRITNIENFVKDNTNAEGEILYPVSSINEKTGDVILNADDVGAAPAGYGYGEPCISFYSTGSESVTNLENALNETLAGMLDKEAKQICVTCTGIADTTLYGTLYRHTADYAIIKLTTYYQDSSITKCKWAGKWEPHSWENPPMIPGVEYRTTERWNGKAVYTKLFDCGACVQGVTGIATGLNSTNRIVRYSAGAATTFFLPAGSTVIPPGDGAYDIWVSMTVDRIYVNKKSSDVEHVYCTVHYTKD